VEIGNNVFMQYQKNSDGTFSELKSKNIDFGGGLERMLAAALHSLKGIDDVFLIDLFEPVIKSLETLSGLRYADTANQYSMRVIADHIRGAVFMIGDGILPGNTEQGYFVRRLLRRSVRYADKLGIPAGEMQNFAENVIEKYKDYYTNLNDKREDIKQAIAQEEAQFRKTLENGLKQFHKISLQIHMKTKEVDGKKVLDKSSAEAIKAISAQKRFRPLYYLWLSDRAY
jgi:alanyl-tRNA synthetase